jgi:hypothetical protein
MFCVGRECGRHRVRSGVSLLRLMVDPSYG